MLLRLLFTACLVGIITCQGNPSDNGDEFAMNENNPNIIAPHEGDHLDHGDIMFRKDEEELIFGGHGTQDQEYSDSFKRDALRNVNKRWKLPIAYEITGSIDSKGRRGISLAIQEYAAKTCIRFRQRTSSDRDYISFFRGGGCYSYVGRSGGKQQVSIGNGCHHQTTVVHEIMHALGFYHEQSRPDRDSFVTINLQNVNSQNRHNFNKQTSAAVTTLGHGYDYASVMHYSKTAFSNNGRATIVVKGNANQALGRGYSDTAGMSAIDAGQLNVMYCGNNPVTPGPVVTTPRPIITPRPVVTIRRRRVFIRRRRWVFIRRRRVFIRRRRVFIRRRRFNWGDQKSKSSDPKEKAKRTNEIKEKLDEAANMVEELTKALENDEETTGMEEIEDEEATYDEQGDNVKDMVEIDDEEEMDAEEEANSEEEIDAKEEAVIMENTDTFY